MAGNDQFTIQERSEYDNVPLSLVGAVDDATAATVNGTYEFLLICNLTFSS